MNKKCSKCGEIYFLNEFYKHLKNKDGMSYSCKKCHNIVVLRYFRTINGLISKIYANQKYNSKRKNHSPPSYTKQELTDWLLNQELFHKLFNNWVKSGYKKEIIPSVDRKNDYKGYFFNNIQLMTWGENKLKYRNNPIEGINNKKNKKVLQYDLDGNFIKEYYSIKYAETKTGVYVSNICSACKGKLKTAGGFLWKYKLN